VRSIPRRRAETEFRDIKSDTSILGSLRNGKDALPDDEAIATMEGDDVLNAVQNYLIGCEQLDHHD
jgi:hypothetical protein